MEYIVDRAGQGREKNRSWSDFPTIGITRNDRVISGKSMGWYYTSWNDYAKKMIETGREKEITQDIFSLREQRL